MCGRFSLTATPDQLIAAFPAFLSPNSIHKLEPRYNIAPSQPVAVITNEGNHQLDYYSWGLIPAWAKDPKIGYKMINARSETLAEKPSFKSPYRYRRCIIPASGFFEWKREPGKNTKIPHHVQMNTKLPFAMAGLWEIWSSPDGSEIRSCNIITTKPNQIVAPIHNRMPVILPSDAIKQWLDPQLQSPQQLNLLLQPYPAELMEAYPVSTTVNNPRNDSPDCIQPI